MADKFDKMKPFQVKLACKQAGIKVAGKDTDTLRDELRKGSGGQSAGKGGKGKPSKGGKGKPAKEGKGKPAKDDSDDAAPPSEALEALAGLVEELKSEVGDLSTSMGERVAAIESRLDDIEEMLADEGGDGKGDGEGGGDDDEDSEELTAAKETLSEHMSDEDELDIKPEDVKKFKKPELEALAVYLGMDLPEGGLPKIKKAMAIAVEEALDGGGGDGDGDTDVPGFEGPDGETIVAVDESIFSIKGWKKKGEFHGQTLFIIDAGTIAQVEVSACKKDGDGDMYLDAEAEGGDKYTLYEIGMEPKSGVGILGFEAE